MDSVSVKFGFLVFSGIVFTFALWEYLKGETLDADEAQIGRLVAEKRCRDDDKRLQSRRRREKRHRSEVRNKEQGRVSQERILKRQNTM